MEKKMEKFTVPCVAAIIEKITNNEKYILIQTRQKEDGAETNESQNIHWIKFEELKKILKNNPEKIFLLHINALQKYLEI